MPNTNSIKGMENIHNHTTKTTERGETITTGTPYGTVIETKDGKIYTANKKGGYEDLMCDLLRRH